MLIIAASATQEIYFWSFREERSVGTRKAMNKELGFFCFTPFYCAM